MNGKGPPSSIEGLLVEEIFIFQFLRHDIGVAITISMRPACRVLGLVQSLSTGIIMSHGTERPFQLVDGLLEDIELVWRLRTRRVRVRIRRHVKN